MGYEEIGLIDFTGEGGREVKVKVRCTLIVEVEMPDCDACFMIEENGCPGTGSVGMAIDEAIELADEENGCWACGLSGENKILEIDGVAVRGDGK